MSRSTSTMLTKTCSSCGQQKPLSAFRQLADTQGIIYSNICADCRKANAEKAELEKDDEKSSGSDTEHAINYKVKIKDAKDKRDFWKQKKEELSRHQVDRNKQQLRKTEDTLDVAKTEKKVRSQFGAFLDKTPKVKPAKEKVFGGESHKAEANKIDFAHRVDYGVPQMKYSSPLFNSVKKWLGPGRVPFVDATEKAITAGKDKEAAADKKNPDNLLDHLENRHKPRK